MAFDVEKYVIKVQGGKKYLPVAARLIWFRQEKPDWGITTHPVEINLEKQYAIFTATIFNAEGKIMGMGTKMENVRGFADYVEKSETSAIGRALAICGFSTGDALELDEGQRYADAPQPVSKQTGGNGHAEEARTQPATREVNPERFRALQSQFKTLAKDLNRETTSDALFALYNRILKRDGVAAEQAPDIEGLEYCVGVMQKKLEEKEDNENVQTGGA